MPVSLSLLATPAMMPGSVALFPHVCGATTSAGTIATTLLVVCWLVVLAWGDSRHRRITAAVVAGGVVVAAAYALVLGTVPRALAGGGVLLVCYFLPYLWGAGIGGGDVKAAFPLGMVAGAVGWTAWWTVALGAFIVTALVGVGQQLLSTHLFTSRKVLSCNTLRGNRGRVAHHTVPHGVSLALVTSLVVLAHLATTLC